MKKLLSAFQFLTIIPVGRSVHMSDEDIAGAGSFFALVGLAQGIFIAASYHLSTRYFDPDLAAVFPLLLLVLSNGGFHLDGLADTFDAIAARTEGRPEMDRAKRLSVMKDSSTGPIGVTAIVFALALKYLTLKNISVSSSSASYAALTLMPIISKWTMVISMAQGRPAREDGLGNFFIRETGLKESIFATITFAVLLYPLALLIGERTWIFRSLFCGILLVVMSCFSTLWVKFCDRRFGGLTGDTLGALSEISEVLFLFMVILWLRLFI